MSYDIHYQIVDPDVQVVENKLFTFAFTSAVAVQGPQKLVNRWLKCLLTPKGSDLSDVNYGTSFPDMLGANFYELDDILDTAALAIEDCNEQLVEKDRLGGLPADERLGSATIREARLVSKDRVDLWVLLRSASNQTLTVQLPTATVS